MEDCVFCKIVRGDTPATFEKETANLVVFKDSNPQAAIHFLVVPKKHVKDMSEAEDELWKEIKDLVVGMARTKGLSGFRLVHNAGDAAAVPHMHVHFLGDVTPDRAV